MLRLFLERAPISQHVNATNPTFRATCVFSKEATTLNGTHQPMPATEDDYWTVRSGRLCMEHTYIYLITYISVRVGAVKVEIRKQICLLLVGLSTTTGREGPRLP